MTLEDRERNFEKALGRELKDNGASGLDCPDAETLAAYHDRMLSPEEMAAQKTHIAACPRCQQILATLEVTEAIPSGAEDSEKVLVKTADLAGLRMKSASVREMPKRKAFVRWAVPAGAIAAGLLVWIAINSGRSAMMTKQNAPVTVAENREQKETPLGAPQPEAKKPAPSSAMSDYVENDRRALTKQESEAFSVGDLAKAQSETQDKTMARGRAATPPAVNHSHGPRQLQNQANQAQNQMAYQTQNNGQIAAQNHATEFDRRVEAPIMERDSAALEQNAPRRNEQAMKAAPAAPPPAPTPAAAAGAAGGKPDDAGKRKDADAKDTEIQTATQMAEVTGADASVSEEKASKEAIATRKLKVIGGFTAANLRDASGRGVVRTPDAQVLWFFTASGVVFKTEDGGKTTRAQKIGEGIKVLAGSAPDAKTCWLLAEKGIVLRTKDGGKKWVTVTAPADGNFTMITGLDAMSALITDASGRVSYSTTDGGATWKVVAQK